MRRVLRKRAHVLPIHTFLLFQGRGVLGYSLFSVDVSERFGFLWGELLVFILDIRRGGVFSLGTIWY